uniref:Putative glutamate receptor-interacting protein 1 n=1 Tax=Nyssomyia neivai TaxID=330878 RepID=A0A1L8DKL8_9DIPT
MGDQLVALNAVAVPGKDSNTPCLLNEPPDQVFLRLVRRLATLQTPPVELNQLQLDNTAPCNHQGGDINENCTVKSISDRRVTCAKYQSELNNNNGDESVHPRCEEEIGENEKRDSCVNGASSFGDEICVAKLINCGSDIDEESDSEEVRNRLSFCEDKEHRHQYTMGTNASRHSGKGLSGRRSQSSGNLCNGKHQTPNGTQSSRNGPKVNLQHGIEAQNNTQATTTSNRRCDDNCSRINSTCTLRSEVYARNGEGAEGSAEIDHVVGVSIKDRNKFCGSLPILDVDDIEPDTNFSNTQNKYVTSAGVLKCTSENNGTMDRVEYVTVAPRKYPPVQQNSQQSDQQYPGKQSSPYNSSSGKGSITSSSNLGGSTFKGNLDNKLELQLKMPVTRVNFDPSCDQGYGSERSPEDELPPPLFVGAEDESFGIPRISSHVTYWSEDGAFRFNNLGYDFITKDCTFSVQIAKGPRGLGLSISGGVESNSAFPGLIRIKRLFPHQAAWATGMLHPGDILLEANGTPLTGLTNYEALEVLRTTPNNILLIVCRPNDEQYRKLSPPSEPPRPPQRTNLFPTTSQPYFEPLSPLQTNFNGEFEIILVKQQGSLGFTLRKEDESVLGHYVRALVREPATTDGRIKPGDKIMAVNDVPLSHMTHEEAVIFLRQAAETVKLRLYRDVAQTPVAALSPTNPENKDISDSLKTKVYLRPEAINLLSDLAHRKQTPCSGDSSGSSMKSSATSPRRLRRCAKSSLSGSQTQSDCGSANYVVCSQPTSSSVYSDSEVSTLSQASNGINVTHCASGCCNSDTYTIREGDSESEVDTCVTNDTEILVDERQVANRPSFLNLGAATQSGNTPVVSRKPMFQFTVPSNAYELNNLDNEVLDAPIYHQSRSSSRDNQQGDASQDFTSLPCETFLVACKTESDLRDMLQTNFNHRNPIYQSAQLQMNRDDGAMSSENTDDGIKQDGTKSLLKWKGVMFSPEGECKEEEIPEATGENDSMDPPNPTDRENLLKGLNRDGYKMITVELHRGWNSRLGFSLQTDKDKRAVISAIYSDSVAAKDGRLRVGDQILMVNDELVNTTQTSEIIDLLRIIRGSICIVIQRKEQER